MLNSQETPLKSGTSKAEKTSTNQKNEPKPDLLAETDDGLPEKYEPLVNSLVEELRRESPDLFK